MTRRSVIIIVCMLMGISFGTGCSTPTRMVSPPSPSATPAPDLTPSISVLRDMGFDEPNQNDSEALASAIGDITNAGPEGARALKEELAVMEQAGEEDVEFKLLAAYILWDIGELEEADTIADVWSSIPADQWVYELLFIPAFQAASTQDSRALPMLKVLTLDNQGKFFSERHYLSFEYPRTHEFLWGSYGSKGLPVLHELLQTSEDPIVLSSAIGLLTRAQYLPALPDIRKAVDNEATGVRNSAIVALGGFGHPDDYDLLIAGLDSTDTGELLRYVFSLAQFGDSRAAAHLIPLLESDEADLRQWVALGLGEYLTTPEGLLALRESAASSNDEDWADYCEALVQNVLDSAGLTWEEYEALPDSDQAEVTHAFLTSSITLKGGEESISRDEFLEMVAEWRETGHIALGNWDWVEVRHVLPVATADDIDLLLDAKSRFYLRLSDECLYDTAFVDEIVKFIGRGRYR